MCGGAYCQSVPFSFICLVGDGSTFGCYKIILGLVVNFRSPKVVILIRDSLIYEGLDLVLASLTSILAALVTPMFVSYILMSF